VKSEHLYRICAATLAIGGNIICIITNKPWWAVFYAVVFFLVLSD
jgi:hypothetical protein